MEKTEIMMKFLYEPVGFINLERKYTLIVEYKGEQKIVGSIKISVLERIVLFFKKLFTNQTLERLLYDKFSKIDQMQTSTVNAVTSLFSKMNSNYNAYQVEDALKYPDYKDWYFDENLYK